MDVKLKDFLCMLQGVVTIELPVSKTTITVDGYTNDVLNKEVLDLNVVYAKPILLNDGQTSTYICLEED